MVLLDVMRDFQTCIKHLVTKDQPTLDFMLAVGISSDEALRLANDHPNRQLFLRNLCDQVAVYEKRFRGKANVRERALIIAASSEMYVKGIIEARRQQNLSEAEKVRIRNQDSLKNDVAQLIKEVPDNASGTKT